MKTEKEITRRFSKRITVGSIGGFFAIAGVGLITGNANTHHIIEALGPWVLGLILVYMGIGYGDYRISKGLPSFTDIFTILATRKRPPLSRNNEASDD